MASRRGSSFGGTKLGYKEGAAVRADDALKQIGEVRGPKQIANKDRPGFDHSPVRYVHKFTDNTEYNARADPLLQAYFVHNTAVQKNLIAQALMTPDKYILQSEKISHIRRMNTAIAGPAAQEKSRLDQARLAAKQEKQKSFKELCESKLQNWKKVQIAEGKMVEAIKEKVDANRVSVADAALTEQGRLYVEEKKEEFEHHAEEAELRRFELEAERQVKAALREKRLAEEKAAKKAALEEAIELAETELSQVKANIVKTKETAAATMQRIKEDTERKQKKATSEAREFRVHLTTVMTERELKQEADIQTRKERTARENEARIAKREKEKRELEEFRARQRAVETAAREKKQAEMKEEERLRKLQQLAEKEARKEAKRKFQEQQAELALQNKALAEEERMKAKEAEMRFVQEQEEIRETRKAKNAIEKKSRAEARAKQEAEAAALKKFEAEHARATMAAEMAASEKAFAEEQERLWQQALNEEMLIEGKRVAKKKADEKLREIAQAEEEREKERVAIMQRKAAEEKIKKEKEKKIKLQKAKEEMERRIAYMKKFGV